MGPRYSEGVLQVRLLGRVAANRDGEQLSLAPPISRLLAVLALRPGPHDREAVAAYLWPGAAGPAARANLRTAVWALRKAVGDGALITSRTTVGLHPETVTVDLADCRRRVVAGDASAAAALCHDELLAGYVEDWAEAAISCQVLDIEIVWQLAEAGAGTSINVNVSVPEREARRLDDQHRVISESLRRLTALAEAAS